MRDFRIRFLRYSVASIILSGLIACSSYENYAAPDPLADIAATHKIFHIPEIGVTQESELGDTLLRKIDGYFRPAIQLENHVLARGDGESGWIERPEVLPQTLYAAFEDDGFVYYYARDVFRTDLSFNPLAPAKYGARISKADGSSSFFTGEAPGYEFEVVPTPVFSETLGDAYTEQYFEQELIYNGKSGQSVRFLYRELTGNSMKDAFQQEALYDLDDSRIVGFKGARIEIISASNTKLKYRVLNGFP